MGWLGLSDREIAQTLLDPEKNGGRTFDDLLHHMNEDPLVLWAWDPGEGRTPPPVPHDEFVHFQGNFDTLTCWTPVGDCPVELGGLAVIPGSHKVNRVLEHHFSLVAGALSIDEHAQPEIDPVWHSIDYEIGDTLFFPTLPIHKALPNYTEDRLRLSLDNRYHAVGDPIAAHMLGPHLSTLDWETVYRDWGI